MATRSTPELVHAARAWEDDLDYPSAVLSGIVGDARHRASGGYHISIEDNPPGNYSVVRVDDAAPPGKWPRDRAAAIDMSMSPKDMVKCYKRVRAVWSNPADPRRRFFNAFNVWDGSGDAVRLDFVTGTASYATPDHKWHNHGEWRRRYVNDPAATRAMLSMLRGESVAAYQKEEDDVSWSERIKRRPWVTQTWPHLGEDARADATLAGIYGFSRLSAERAAELLAGQRAILAAIAGQDVAEAAERAAREGARAGAAEALDELAEGLADRLTEVPAEQVRQAVAEVLRERDRRAAGDDPQ